MSLYELEIEIDSRNKKYFECFVSRLYDLNYFINYAINSSSEKIIFNCNIDGLYAIKQLIKELPNENVTQNFYGCVTFSLHFYCDRYNNRYLPLLQSLLSKNVFDIEVKQSSTKEIIDGLSITIKSCWKDNLDAIIKKLPKEEIKILNRR